MSTPPPYNPNDPLGLEDALAAPASSGGTYSEDDLVGIATALTMKEALKGLGTNRSYGESVKFLMEMTNRPREEVEEAIKTNADRKQQSVDDQIREKAQGLSKVLQGYEDSLGKTYSGSQSMSLLGVEGLQHGSSQITYAVRTDEQGRISVDIMYDLGEEKSIPLYTLRRKGVDAGWSGKVRTATETVGFWKGLAQAAQGVVSSAGKLEARVRDVETLTRRARSGVLRDAKAARSVLQGDTGTSFEREYEAVIYNSTEILEGKDARTEEVIPLGEFMRWCMTVKRQVPLGMVQYLGMKNFNSTVENELAEALRALQEL